MFGLKAFILQYKLQFAFCIILSFQVNILFSQSNEDCFACHEDTELTATKNGKTISMFVDSKIMNNSVHKKLECIKCHKDAAVEEFPHNENLNTVNCGNCHAKHADLAKTDIHSKLQTKLGDKAPTCKSCHNTHNVVKTTTIDNKFKEYCSKCHTQNVLAGTYHVNTAINDQCLDCHKDPDYKMQTSKSVHSSLLCTNCHSSIVNNLEGHQSNPEKDSKADCYMCHGEIAALHKESIHGISLSEGVEESANCWDCHGSHNIFLTSNDSSSVNHEKMAITCGKCHDNTEFNQKFNSSIKQPGKMYSLSIHGKLAESGSKDAPTCITCHGIHDIKNRIQQGSKISAINLPATCAQCHKEISDEYTQSIHWIAAKKGVRESPTCNNCHSEHSMQLVSTLHKSKEINKLQEETCLQCHQNLLLSQRYGLSTEKAQSYQDSYHGLAVMHGDTTAAMCVDCHGVHKILPKHHEQSSVNEKNVTATCKKCHKGSSPEFAKSYSHATSVNSDAKFIEDIVRKIYFWLIILIIGSMIVHNIIIFIHDVYERWRNSQSKIRVPRLTFNELIQHILLTISFVALVMTGFQLKYPGSWWSDGMTALGLDEALRRNVHRGAAVILILLSIYHVLYLFFTPRGRYVLKSMLPVFSDFGLAVKNVLFHLGLTKKHPDFDNYNYMEKAEYWALVWGTVIMAITGFVLWLPTIATQHFPAWIIKVSEIIHFYEAILATLAILVWHLFFVMFRPKNYPIDFTTIDGKISVEHFKEGHQLVFRKIIIEWLEVRTGKRKPEKMSHITKYFMKSIEKNGVNANDFVDDELNKDSELKSIVEKQNLINTN